MTDTPADPSTPTSDALHQRPGAAGTGPVPGSAPASDAPAPQPSPRRRAAHDAPFLAAARGDRPSRRPVWMMRQAGRSLPEYREIRRGTGMLEACFTPEILAEVTMQPVRRHDADAAILFSDIVVPLKAAGVDVDIVAGRGPVVEHPVRTAADVAALPTVTEDQLAPVVEGIGGVLGELRPDQVLIGFAGAPFTLASYLIEGGPSRNHERTKALAYSDPDLWHALMAALTPTVIRFLTVQAEAGVDAVQLFDSWVGHLSVRDYDRLVAPYTRRIFEAVRPYGIPTIHFGVGTGELLGTMAATGPDVMGVDWRVPLDTAAGRVAEAVRSGDPSRQVPALQGNLDPAVLFAGDDAVRRHVDRICAEADHAVERGDARGHIFNLGHGVLPDTDPDVITRVFERVHAR
ncbi:uroporphyrinogen decarboxylase [Corynebacterium bovis]|uniref:uroporphyrinogen decarboxylase n=3 Tax=Corynebacterium bovis TaxID=36808 RepID=UPI000F64C594|nr:uroporphyrinogen decarboxylase [Corynebacterium bovis]RRO82594.1 uroporphyrinogen decarboxylase [Corynebacterium bovis]RRO83379.1 uroporphyrinogen decarboxylase [Corynebacterium bovis]RRO89788.1 uroporphyrinogen decarboxylase [Corynebacterium bovis]RRQ14294.1 uroporphyrinogen decarboxylase [Corynebacterium bovis]RRQ16560.1 uroporphyrinogen decarboxylase [Corynebacterium bovis]